MNPPFTGTVLVAITTSSILAACGGGGDNPLGGQFGGTLQQTVLPTQGTPPDSGAAAPTSGSTVGSGSVGGAPNGSSGGGSGSVGGPPNGPNDGGSGA